MIIKAVGKGLRRQRLRLAEQIWANQVQTPAVKGQASKLKKATPSPHSKAWHYDLTQARWTVDMLQLKPHCVQGTQNPHAAANGENWVTI